METSGYRCSEFGGRNIWRNSDEEHAATVNWGGEMEDRSIGQTIGDALIMELDKREQDGFERMVQHGRNMQLEPDDAMDYASADGKYSDEVPGKELNAAWVIKARLEALHEFRKHGVYRKVPREECVCATPEKH